MSSTKSTLLLISITAAWGSSFILMKNGANEISGVAFVALRFILTSIILTITFAPFLKSISLKLIKHSAIIAFWLFLCLVAQVYALRFTSASNTAFITALGVVVVPIFSAVILRKAPTLSNVFGIILATGGLVFITGVYRSFSMLNKGDIITLVSVIFITMQVILTDRYATQTDDPILLGVCQIWFVALYSTIAWFFSSPETFFKITYSTELVTAVVLTSIICTAYAFTAQIVAQKYVSPTRVAVVFTLEPVFALMYALYIPGPDGNVEILTSVKLLGCIFIVGGALFSEVNLFGKIKKLLF